MICIITSQGPADVKRLMVAGKFKICLTEQEAQEYIRFKTKAGFLCHRFDYLKSFGTESNVIEIAGVI